MGHRPSNQSGKHSCGKTDPQPCHGRGLSGAEEAGSASPQVLQQGSPAGPSQADLRPTWGLPGLPDGKAAEVKNLEGNPANN